ncbi:MAG: FtsX-like permease family protein, partial [Dehalococcoidia bacterium]|nr:FtsX-like permease family protein [Dehalococcoidia bacterium]
MNELFGLSMNLIAVVMLVAFGLCMAVFAGIFFANRTMFRMGLRNIGRRRAQTALVVSGLMLATVIITAAFTTGDVIDYSATKMTYDNLQRTDLSLHHFRTADASEPTESSYAPEPVTAGFEHAFAGDPDIEGFVPFLYEPVPVLNPGTRLSEPVAILSGFDGERLARFGGLRLAGGGEADILALGDDEVLAGKRIAEATDTQVGDTIVVFAQNRQVPLRVTGIVKDERASGALDFGPGVQLGGMAVKLATAQRITGREGLITTINVALRGGVRDTLDRIEPAEKRLLAFEADNAAKSEIGLGDMRFQVEPLKADAMEAGRLTASTFTTAFLVLGLFSIAAGAMLIFTLFVMLAAERRSEMGIARAVGAQRTHLVQAFVAEGVVYELLAGLVGVLVGVAAALVLVVGGVKMLMGGELSMITAHVAPRSLVVSFCLGAVLTFLTVTFSSLRISQLNVVAAVRGQVSQSRGHEPKRRTRWVWVVLGVLVFAPIPPLGIYWMLRKGLGMSWAWIIGPAGLFFGVGLIALGGATQTAFPFSLGVSLVILAVASNVEYYGVARRAAWTAGGLVLAIYWMFPTLDIGDRFFGEFHETGMEMFVLSGIMIVTAMTTVTVFNARLLTRMFTAQRKGASKYYPAIVTTLLAIAAVVVGVMLGDRADSLGQLGYLVAIFLGLFAMTSALAVRFPRFAPAFKMAVAYPLANRFRTGMTIAMFSIVVFSITVMGILNTSFLHMFQNEDGRGGWNIIASTNENNPVDDLEGALRDAGFDSSVITASGRTTQFDDDAQEVRRPGGGWQVHPVITGDTDFFANAQMKFEGRAKGYASDRELYAAVASNPDLALLDAAPLDLLSAIPFHISVDIEDGEFESFPLEMRDAVTGRSRTVTVVGILTSRIPAGLLMGLYTNESAYREVFGPPKYDTVYLRTSPASDDARLAKDIKATLMEKGVQAVSIQEEIDNAVAMSVAFLRIFQAFMALGLFVGIAALGVIALRSVVERRQQIGMLRAIGYQRGTVALSFMLESGFIAMTGIVAGVVGASVLSWSLI